ncbi:RagB/SusD family nutrient uptake outer membrane protein [Gemmatimonas sp.]|uniref:RagB/SusD family nutrient uptake outer membrane protein n=1 Tax=Gemmatimonas sp. TaxID=1962908 RepID=UPI00391C3388
MRNTMKVLTAVASLGLTAACGNFDRLLTVQTPSRLAEEAFLVPANAALISASAVADYECALGGYVVASGLAAGELVDATQTAARWNYDRRNVEAVDALYSTSGCEGIGVYTPINTARYTNDQAVQRLSEWTDAQVPNRQRLIALNSAMAGFSLLLLGEGFCEGVIGLGSALTPTQLFDSAEVRFTRAIAAATTAGDANVLNLAYVGRARARINKGAKPGAADDAARVPVGFVYNATADATIGRRNNRIFQQVNQSNATSVAPAYRTLNDPRVSVTDLNRTAPDQINRLWNQNKYSSLVATYPIATGLEAQLILAEARGGAAGVAILNTLRARTGVALPPLTAQESANVDAAVAEERRRELFLQGNRWFDVKRFNLPQVPAAGVPYAKGGVYGDQRCWPLPDAEKLANPNFGR